MSFGMKSLTSSDSLSNVNEKKISRREEVTRLLADRKKEEENNFTFRPTLKKSASSQALEGGSAEDRFQKLYGEARKRQENERKAANYSFKPTINSKGPRRSCTPDATSQRLYDAPGAGKPRRSASAERSKRSFSPQITPRARTIERSDKASSPSSRLYSQAKALKENREVLASKINQETAKECTFTPKTNKDVKAPNANIPLAQRMEKYLALREQRLHDLKEKQQALESQASTFKPESFTKGRSPSAERKHNKKEAINKPKNRSSVPPKIENAVPTVFDRLTNVSTQKKVEHFEKDEKELTFKPNLATKRAASPLRAQEDMKYGSVHNRLYQKGNEQRIENIAKKEQLRREMEKEHTFTPSVPTNHRSNPNSPSKTAVFERLSASRQYVHEILSQVKTEFELDNCTFSPEINKVSDELGSKKNTEPAYLRLSAEAKRLREENAKRLAKKQEEELVDCTFAPTIDKKSTKVIQSKRRENNVSVFDRLTSVSSSPNSPLVEENHPVNVPKTIRRSTLEKLCQSNGVIQESGSPERRKDNDVNMNHDEIITNISLTDSNVDEKIKLVPVSPVTLPTSQPPDVTTEFFEGDEF